MADSIEKSHPELFHYTGISGLTGIIQSQTLWATHANFLNDSMELRAFKERLQNLLRPKVQTEFEQLRSNPANETIIAEKGGMKNVVDGDINLVTDALFNVLNDTPDSSPFFETYIASFCAAESEEISKHGLLSQWRGYGQEGGYAIAFDTSKMCELIDKEREHWPNMLFGGDSVVYSSVSDQELLEKQAEDIKKILDYCLLYLKTKDLTMNNDEHFALVRCACLYKHWGFHEEKEVRIVAILPKEALNKSCFL